MMRIHLLTICLIGSVNVATGQTAANISRPALVRAWHRQFLHREPDARSVAAWSYWFRLGHSEQEVLAAVLSTDEYYRRAGGTSEGLVLAMFEDGAQGQLTHEGRQALLRRARDREALAAAFVQTYPEAIRPRPTNSNVLLAKSQAPLKAEARRSSPPSRRPAVAGAPATRRRPRSLRR